MQKRFLYSVLLTILLVTLGFGYSPTPASASASQPAPLGDDAGGAYVPGQLVVGLAPSVSLGSVATQAATLAQALGVKVLKSDEQGLALLDAGAHRNLQALASTVKRMQGVRYAEPNFTYKANSLPAGSGADGPVAKQMGGGGAPLSASYPNDLDVLTNVGWRLLSADIVWANTTPSKEVCLLDTGVDYLHPDLIGKIIKGPDFVSEDSDPMDDNGQGTHLAGIIAAVANNKEGIVGVSTGKVLAVKVLDAFGIGNVYDLAAGINYCANQSSVSILTVSWQGPDSNTLSAAVKYATLTKAKLLVAAAGDNKVSDPSYNYPAAYTSDPLNYPGVIAVAASGDNNSPSNYQCKSFTSNYGSWITLAAPGTAIYSTTPWDKPFYISNKATGGYAALGGTAQAAAFVSAAAARVWGYLPKDNATAILQRLQDTADWVQTGGACWPLPEPSSTIKMINLARAMDRGAAKVVLYDAVTFLPLQGAKVSVYTSKNAQVGSAVIPSGPIMDERSGMISQYPDFVDVLNLPSYALSGMLTAKISATNYTASPQNAFVGPETLSINADGTFPVTAGGFGPVLDAGVPPETANFAVVGESLMGNYSPRTAVWVPKSPSIPYFIVSYSINWADPAAAQSLPWGSMNADPYARWMNAGLNMFESILIRPRASDSKAPWYAGTYWVGITDGLTAGTTYLDGFNVSALVWKDGLIKVRVDKGTNNCFTNHWWYPLQIVSPSSGSATYVQTPTKCGTLNDAPYHP